MFGDDAEPEPIQPLSGGDDEDADDDFAGLGIEDLPEPEPIPDVFTSPDAEPERKPKGKSKGKDYRAKQPPRKGGAGKLVAAVFVLLLVGAGVGFFVARDQVLELWPGAADIYAMLGAPGETVGAGLDIRVSGSDRVPEGGIDFLIVRGDVINQTDATRKLPLIKVTLLNQEGRELQSVVVSGQVEEVPPAESVPFVARIKDPAATARRLEVAFTSEGTVSPDQ